MTSISKEFKTIGNTEFSEEKTEKLIESIRESGLDISLENLSYYLKTQGVIVDVHVGGGNIEIELSPKAYGVNEIALNETSKKTMKNHVRNAKISFLSKEKGGIKSSNGYGKRLDSLESRVRMQRSRMSMGYNNSFMTLEVFDEFKKKFFEAKEEFESLKDEILLNYDSLVNDFKRNVRDTLASLGAIDLESEYVKIVSRFGEKGTAHYDAFKEKYAAGFYFDMSLKAFPVAESLEFFDPEIKRGIEDGINEDSVKAMYEIIGNALADGFKAAGLILLNAETKSEIPKKTLLSLAQASKKLRSKNIFANTTIDDIAEDLELISKMVDFETQVEVSENTCVKAWAYAKEIGVESSIVLKDSPLSFENLEELAQFI